MFQQKKDRHAELAALVSAVGRLPDEQQALRLWAYVGESYDRRSLALWRRMALAVGAGAAAFAACAHMELTATCPACDPEGQADEGFGLMDQIREANALFSLLAQLAGRESPPQPEAQDPTPEPEAQEPTSEPEAQEPTRRRPRRTSMQTLAALAALFGVAAPSIQAAGRGEFDDTPDGPAEAPWQAKAEGAEAVETPRDSEPAA